jgi:1-acyl-sn-glycerol-3-phosphate acyltransferase
MGASINGMMSNGLYWLVRNMAWVLLHLVCRCRVHGREYVPTSGPLLIVANHMSWFDPLLLGALLPRRLWFYTKIEMFHWPVVGWLCKKTGQIPVNRGEGDRSSLVQALAYLREGKAVVVFPEGTVERQEQMIAAHTGVAMLAIRSGAMLLPVAHTGTRRVLRPGRGWWPKVDVEIGKAYTPSIPEGATRKAGLQAITLEVMTQIAEMLPAEQRGVYK